ncbi:hypothetical protein C8J56DRAFT_886601 [Mycena floridula]|nr:hypothetical protein C8J56DRAFT_886601 [Mycena floridula]
MTPSSGPRASSPIIGTASEKQAIRRRKGQRSRAPKMAEIYASKAEAKQADTPDTLVTGFTPSQSAAMDGALDSLQQKGISFHDLMFYVFDLVNKKGNIRWDGFFKQRNSATEYVGTEAKAEARRITASGFLQMMNCVIDTNLIKKLSMSLLFSYLRDEAPTMLSVTTAFTTSTVLGLSGLKDKARISCEKCIGTYNCSNNLFKHIFGLYLYATGSQRQAITVISHLGLSESYNGVVGKKHCRAPEYLFET